MICHKEPSLFGKLAEDLQPGVRRLLTSQAAFPSGRLQEGHRGLRGPISTDCCLFQPSTHPQSAVGTIW
ncbi:hypothetical protein WJX72_006213 [[Myrmecia] bisecta]|uniref:Uncharacterized protein n=1 Tax=[Myrmecia] bisecta TaxID=41462 RepID=A0AAW1PFW7_9CHLO